MTDLIAYNIKDIIQAANDEFIAVFKTADPAALASLYTTAGKMLPPNADFVDGRPAIQAFWQGIFESGLTAAKLETIEAELFGDTTFEVGRYTLFAGDQIADEGKYIVVWKQQDGKWKLHRDIFNSSRPAPC